MSLFTDYLSLSGIFIIGPIILLYFAVRSVMKSMRRDKEREQMENSGNSIEQKKNS